jgi:2-polyprenyl-6-methoxyphenol hydroxylase-like FAD-dependent oxidoreductase
MATDSHAPTALIQGSGIVAHVCALLLSRQGIQVRLSAPATGVTPGHGDVRAYALNQVSVDLLSELRIWQAMPEASVCAVKGMALHTGEDSPVSLDPLPDHPDMAWIVDVPALEQILRQALSFAPGVQVLQAGQVCDADLTIVCEGRLSATRTRLGVDFRIDPYEHTALAARLRCALPHGQVARQWFGQPGRGDILALLPLGEDGNSVALVWSTAHERTAQHLSMSPDEFSHALASACGHALGSMELISERMAWPLQRATASRQCGTGWVLVGDAAHNVHPLAGQGLNLGLADAAALARTLREREGFRSIGEERLLRRCERTRALDTLLMGEVTDGIYRSFAHTDPRAQTLRHWGIRAVQAVPALKQFMVRRAMGNTPREKTQ